MLTPIEIENVSFKSGRGYSKKEVDAFLNTVHHDYEALYKENRELKDKLNTLSDGVQYYKNIEKTLQKALVLAEKTSTEIKEAAVRQAEAIEKEAYLKANTILADAKHELNRIQNQIIALIQNFDQCKAQIKQITMAQMELLESESFSVKVSSFDLEPSFVIKNDVLSEKEETKEPEEMEQEIMQQDTIQQDKTQQDKTQEDKTQEEEEREMLMKLFQSIEENSKQKQTDNSKNTAEQDFEFLNMD
ncbi:DivIVA domain-containing protein [Anaeromicropila populeti]|uniref:Cell division initiation protein n=1 Tax=Anaeromicropila populeti TaxID=37658 RepID=A0A1I6L8A9_9FIRM|nr:DivIVA domain-containing protein [Anaeromicropila populeti]SFR99725.1 cell division initiation protein [Anaeromicropila populeti]